MNEVRIKLHADVQTGVQNIWMSLNYDKKPTIGHILNQLKKNFNCDDDGSISLYLDEYWLPPWENSRLLRENDCIRVEIIKTINEKPNNSSTTSTSLSTNIQSANYYEPIKQQLQEQAKLKEKNILKTNDLNLKTSNKQQQQQQVEQQKKKKDDEMNNFFLDTLNALKQQTLNSPSSSSSSSSSTPKNNTKPNNKQKAGDKPAAKNQTPHTKVNNTNQNKASNNLNKNTRKPISSAAHKKFAVANYVHLLNETNEPEVDEFATSKVQQQQEETDEVEERDFYKKSTSGSYNNNIELIAQSINATAKSKWKNSNNVDRQQNITTAATTMPKHIRFESSSEDSSSSSNSSSSSESSDDENNQKNNNNQVKPVNNNNQAKPANNNNTKKSSPKQQKQQPKQQKQQQNNWKPFTKEEQLNMTPKSLDDFVKVFNKTKLNAPVNGDDNQNVEKKTKKLVDFEKLESFSGIPKPNDQIAFQILEISSSFTPEISDYKAGTVLAYDEKTNEVTLRLDGSSYNEVLNKPNKFTVVEEEEYENDEEESNNKSRVVKKDSEKDEDDNILRIDWASLINVKRMDRNVDAQNEPQQSQVDPSEQQQQPQQLEQAQNVEENLVKENTQTEEAKSDQLQN